MSVRQARRLAAAAAVAAASLLATASSASAAVNQAFLDPQPRPFAATSTWNTPLPADAALSPRSIDLSNRLRSDVATYGTWINSYQYSAPVYTVDGDAPTVPVTLDRYNGQLAAAFAAVPLPADAVPAKGSDAQLVVVQPDTGKMWEFWKLRKTTTGWRAAWGGWNESLYTASGVFANSNFGAAASGLPLLGGMPRLWELDAGVIEHAVALTLPKASGTQVAAPAVRTDGTDTSADAIPMGTRFRIDPDVNLVALNLPRTTYAIALAAQRYGMIVRDTTGSTVAFEMEDPTPAGVNQNERWFAGKSASQILAKFPWQAAEVFDAPTTPWTGPIAYPVPAPVE